jgi:DNA-binding transcriptional LysR family regulator
MITSEDLEFFAVVATSPSLAAAARRLDVTPPAVSQRLRLLETRAGVKLVERGSRRLRLTESGALVAAQGAAVTAALASLTEALGARTRNVTGHLRIAAPHGFGRLHVAPVVDAFARQHPDVTVTLDLSDHPGARLIENCDLVIHIGAPGPANEVVTKLAPNRRFLCASPDYVASAAPIREPADLARHRCLVVRENDEDVTLWRLQRGGDAVTTVRVKPAMSSNDGAVVRDWALGGQGIALRSEWNVADDVARGRLVVVLPKWELPAADVVAMVGSRQGRSARATRFLAMLRKALSPAPWRSRPRGA